MSVFETRAASTRCLPSTSSDRADPAAMHAAQPYDLVSDLFQNVFGDAHREACDVAAGLVAGLAAA